MWTLKFGEESWNLKELTGFLSHVGSSGDEQEVEEMELDRVHGFRIKWFVESRIISTIYFSKKGRCVFKSHKTHTNGKVGH